ncbi:hypothetical protein BDZ85DRAFT_251132 [Elsinoe ampelina]|uniref:Uncharacterized protein n=1 Tax=Elsinoe ampelina TaxID=302913 RepID=A0A6A6G709_9PEZI|nr:hypothetical protein BDZ85DRAFT_251132 [Elsinoe ampelina]
MLKTYPKYLATVVKGLGYNSRAAGYSRKKCYYTYLRERDTLFLLYTFLLALRYTTTISYYRKLIIKCRDLNPDTASITSLTTAITSAKSRQGKKRTASTFTSVYSYTSIKLSKVEEKDR